MTSAVDTTASFQTGEGEAGTYPRSRAALPGYFYRMPNNSSAQRFCPAPASGGCPVVVVKAGDGEPERPGRRELPPAGEPSLRGRPGPGPRTARTPTQRARGAPG